MTAPFATPLAALMGTHARSGRIEWLGVRSERRGEVVPVERATIIENGLEGDHRARPGKRAVTLIQAEHLPVIAALVGPDAPDVTWQRLRRNIVVSGINLLALRDATFCVGSATLRGTGICAPCSRMTETFGPGGYNAIRGHGGITAEVLVPGRAAIGDPLTLQDAA